MFEKLYKEFTNNLKKNKLKISILHSKGCLIVLDKTTKNQTDETLN
jgi:hypothetical protein